MTQPIPNRVYTQGSGTASTDPFIAVTAEVNPLPTNVNYPVQKRWVNTATGAEYFLANYYSSDGQVLANWVALGIADGVGIQTVTGNSGGAVSGTGSPSNINIVGDGTSIAITGNPGTHTLTASYIGAVGGITKVLQQVFTSSGTYTPTTNLAYAIVEVVAGGGGGGCPNDAGGTHIGGGGGSGEYARAVLDSATVGASQAITVGTGGSGASGSGIGPGGNPSSFGSIIICNGGSGGGVAVSTSLAAGGAGGSGGTVPGNGFLASGANGEPGYDVNPNLLGGSGGNSYFGGAGASVYSPVTAGAINGLPGSSYGAGGGGGLTNVSSSLSAQGGAGFNGIVIVTEFIA